MTRDLRIVCCQRSRKKAHAYFAVAKQVQDTQPRPVCKGREKEFRIKSLFAYHTEIFYHQARNPTVMEGAAALEAAARLSAYSPSCLIKQAASVLSRFCRL